MGSCGWNRDEYRAWKRERKAEWRQQKDAWRERGGRYAPGYGWHPVNIAAMVVGFIVFFPLGFAILAWNIWSARNGYGPSQPAFAGMSGLGSTPWSQTNRDLARNSGNSVFEDYKRATLERLEEERRKLIAEQEAFSSFLDDLKKAKDREEFERFMRQRESDQSDAARDVSEQNKPN
jgi:hypothetical protein